MANCERCRYFEPIAESVEGYCRRYPATVRKGVRDWCGEAQRRDDVDWHQIAKDEEEFYDGFRRNDDPDDLRSRS